MDTVEKRILAVIDAKRQEIIDFARDIYRHPEPGYYEDYTAQKVKGFLESRGLAVTPGLARTGVRGDLEKGGLNVTLIGELDAIGCKAHPDADPRNGMAHACGHHAQLASLIGAAIALTDAGVQEYLDGSVSFFAVPAEEYVDAQKRQVLIDREGMEFSGTGKSELVRIGAFDRTDIALTNHVHMMEVKEELLLGNPACNGFRAELVTVHGKPAHAAIAPWEGVNAVSITASALNMIGLMRETFRDEDYVRVHSLIHKAGEVLNCVPDEAILEEKVRAKTLEGIEDGMAKVERAFDGAAFAFGGSIERKPLQGYMPVRFREADAVLIEAAADLGVSVRQAACWDHNKASTDVGDLTHLMPVLNFSFGGFEGSLHGEDFRIVDEEKAYIIPAKMMALTTYKLLKNHGANGKKIVDTFRPVFDKEGYIDYIKSYLTPLSGSQGDE